MTKVLEWFKFVRLVNILIMAMTFYLIRMLVLEPYAQRHSVELVFQHWHFLVLVIVTALTAAAGNIVNDIYDIEIDKINKPNKVFIPQIVSKTGAWRIFYTFNVLAMLLIFWVYSDIDWLLIWMYPFGFFLTWSMLWLYSARFKKSVLIGNIIIGFFVSFVPWSVCYPELVNVAIGTIPNNSIFVFTGIIYIIFAFVSTVLREIIKDIEDQHGDAQFGGRTLPIVHGVAKAKQIGYWVGILLLALVGFAMYGLWQNELYGTVVFALLSVVFPTLYLLLKLREASEKRDYHRLSQIAKIIMLAGLLLLVVLYFEYY